MIRAITIALVLLVSPVAPAAAQAPALWPYDYVWSISADSTHAWDNSDAPFTGDRDVYLWLACSYIDGVSAAAMTLTGTFTVLSFTPAPGITNHAALPDLELTFDSCDTRWTFLAGTLRIRDDTGAGGHVCMAGEGTTSGCASDAYPHGYWGFVTDAPNPCQLGDCAVDFAIPGTWGRVKGSYSAP
jgi:hypothetical protein